MLNWKPSPLSGLALVIVAAVLAVLSASSAHAADYCPPGTDSEPLNPFVDVNDCYCNFGAHCWGVNCCDGSCTFRFYNPNPTCAELPVCWTRFGSMDPPTEEIYVNGVLVDRFTGQERCLGGSSGRRGLCLAPNSVTIIEFRNVNDPGPFLPPPADNANACTANMNVDFGTAQTMPGLNEHFLYLYLSEPLIRPDGLRGRHAGTNSTTVSVVHAVNCGPAPAVVELDTSREDLSGGHDHLDGNSPNATGYFHRRASTLSIPPTGTGTIVYHSGEFSGREFPKATCPAPTCDPPVSADDLLRVEIGALVALPDGDKFQLVGCTATHHHNHYVTGSVYGKLQQVSDRFKDMHPGNPRLHLNDSALQFGGRFDVAGDFNVTGDHSGQDHRLGTGADIKTVCPGNALGNWTGAACEPNQCNYDLTPPFDANTPVIASPAQVRDLETIIRGTGGRPINEADHIHASWRRD